MVSSRYIKFIIGYGRISGMRLDIYHLSVYPVGYSAEYQVSGRKHIDFSIWPDQITGIRHKDRIPGQYTV